MGQSAVFQHEVRGGKPAWVRWTGVLVALLGVFILESWAADLSRPGRPDPVADRWVGVGLRAGHVGLVGMALAPWIDRRRRRCYRVTLADGRLRAEWRTVFPSRPLRVEFDQPVDCIARLLVDRTGGPDGRYDIVLTDGCSYTLALPHGDPDAVWPPLFDALRRARKDIGVEHRPALSGTDDRLGREGEMPGPGLDPTDSQSAA